MHLQEANSPTRAAFQVELDGNKGGQNKDGDK